jgi:hypothetical protein
MIRLSDKNYLGLSEEAKSTCLSFYKAALHEMEPDFDFQLFIKTRKKEQDFPQFEEMFDGMDVYRKEMGQIVREKLREERQIGIERFAVFTTRDREAKRASLRLKKIAERFSVSEFLMDGVERGKVITDILQSRKIELDYDSLLLNECNTKDTLAPAYIEISKDSMRLNDKFVKVFTLLDYPNFLEDTFLYDLCHAQRDIVISLHVRPYETSKILNLFQNQKVLNTAKIIQQEKANYREGISGNYISEIDRNALEALQDLIEGIKKSDQKMFSATLTLLIEGDSLEEIKVAETMIQKIAKRYFTEFSPCYKRQLEGLNTVLPLGVNYLGNEKRFVRDMTTENVTNFAPYFYPMTNSEHGIFYGIHAITRQMILLDRTKELITPSTLVLGSSGSGKSVMVKWNILQNLFHHTLDRMVIVDPEDEYSRLGRLFQAEEVQIFSGSKHHLNILDLVQKSNLDEEDQTIDLVKEKTNLLVQFFSKILKEFNDEEAGIVDRVTRILYKKYQEPTLVEWAGELAKIPGNVSGKLLLKVEPYTIGSMSIFSKRTNIDLNRKFLIFNLKRLDPLLKPVVMKVILDHIWQEVVRNQGVTKTRLFFDELQLNFDTEYNAKWFTDLWSRVRKYGAIPTGITQNVSTLLGFQEGQKMISNTEFTILLRQKNVDLQYLKQMMDLPDCFLPYISDQAIPGTGLMNVGGKLIPFDNTIPTNFDLFKLLET